MNVALIYPPAFLKRWGKTTQYHLILPHLCHQPRYRDFYQELNTKDDWIILDNGAAEEVTFGARHLMTIAETMKVNEVVVPDELFDTEDTIAKALAFSRYADPRFRYMMVAQGSTVSEAIKCIRAAAVLPALSYISTIGIPRLLAHTDPDARLRVAEFIFNEGLEERFEYHALGATNDLSEVQRLVNRVSFLRGIDTSAPIYMGLMGLSVNDSYISRPEDFFSMTKGDQDMTAANIKRYLKWAKYDYNRPAE